MSTINQANLGTIQNFFETNPSSDSPSRAQDLATLQQLSSGHSSERRVQITLGDDTFSVNPLVLGNWMDRYIDTNGEATPYNNRLLGAVNNLSEIESTENDTDDFEIAGSIILTAPLQPYTEPDGEIVGSPFSSGTILIYLEDRRDGWLKVMQNNQQVWIFAGGDYAGVEFPEPIEVNGEASAE